MLFAAIAVAVGIAASLLPVAEWFGSGIAWIQAHREFAWAVFILAYVVATVLIVPGTILTLGAGFAFGLPVGVVLVSVSSVLGAAAAFLVGRYFARDWVKGHIDRISRFQALDQATHTDGLVIVLLVRLSPLFPFNVTNYGFGLTAVRFRDYFFGSWIGMLPGTILYVYIGSLAQNFAEIAERGFETGIAGRALLIGGFIATLVLTLLMTRRATRVLNRRLDAETRETV